MFNNLAFGSAEELNENNLRFTFLKNLAKDFVDNIFLKYNSLSEANKKSINQALSKYPTLWTDDDKKLVRKILDSINADSDDKLNLDRLFIERDSIISNVNKSELEREAYKSAYGVDIDISKYRPKQPVVSFDVDKDYLEFTKRRQEEVKALVEEQKDENRRKIYSPSPDKFPIQKENNIVPSQGSGSGSGFKDTGKNFNNQFSNPLLRGTSFTPGGMKKDKKETEKKDTKIERSDKQKFKDPFMSNGRYVYESWMKKENKPEPKELLPAKLLPSERNIAYAGFLGEYNSPSFSPRPLEDDLENLLLDYPNSILSKFKKEMEVVSLSTAPEVLNDLRSIQTLDEKYTPCVTSGLRDKFRYATNKDAIIPEVDRAIECGLNKYNSIKNRLNNLESLPAPDAISVEMNDLVSLIRERDTFRLHRGELKLDPNYFLKNTLLNYIYNNYFDGESTFNSVISALEKEAEKRMKKQLALSSFIFSEFTHPANKYFIELYIDIKKKYGVVIKNNLTSDEQSFIDNFFLHTEPGSWSEDEIFRVANILRKIGVSYLDIYTYFTLVSSLVSKKFERIPYSQAIDEIRAFSDKVDKYLSLMKGDNISIENKSINLKLADDKSDKPNSLKLDEYKKLINSFIDLKGSSKLNYSSLPKKLREDIELVENGNNVGVPDLQSQNEILSFLSDLRTANADLYNKLSIGSYLKSVLEIKESDKSSHTSFWLIVGLFLLFHNSFRRSNS